MARVARFISGGLVVGAMLTIGACGNDEVAGPDVGRLEVLLTMEGSDRDLNGGTLLLNGEAVGSIQVDVRLILPEVEAGIHVIMVTDIAPNCTPVGVNERNVTVRAGQLAEEEFRFLCESTGGKEPGDPDPPSID